MSSSSEIAVSVRGLSKAYTIAHNAARHTTAGEALMHRLKHPLHRAEKETFWALRDIDFDIKKGDVVGIIGRNGAGKSTLLKILSRITEPTSGQIDLYGRVGSLLEVGTGFHPELTGRENVFLNGAILGMSKRDIARQFDAIVEFSGTEQFLDTPVKRYSSGMYVRLAFAVAAHLNPEILIVDEVLAVGDAEFQKKCLGKMQNVAKSGRTVLFVSHNMAAVNALCNHVLWLDQGRVQDSGSPKSIIATYLNTSYSEMTEQVWNDLDKAPGNEYVRLRRGCVRPLEGIASDVITVRSPFVIEFDFYNYDPDACLNLSLHLYNEDGLDVFNTFPAPDSDWYLRPHAVGLYRSACHIPGDLLNDGTYSIELYVVKDRGHVVYHHSDILSFEVQDSADLRGACQIEDHEEHRHQIEVGGEEQPRRAGRDYAEFVQARRLRAAGAAAPE